MMPPLDLWLEALRAIDGNTSDIAAALLYTDPSTIRYRLNNMEKQVGAKVYNRALRSKPATLTPVGREILASGKLPERRKNKISEAYNARLLEMARGF